MEQNQNIKKKGWVNWILFFATIIIVFLLGMLANSVTQRRTEARLVNTPKVQIKDYEPRNKIWGENYPREYQSYLLTADTGFRSMFNGSGLTDMLELNPKMVILWAGYAFSKDYNQPRGHYYAVNDVRMTLRTGSPLKPDEGPQPSTCWACKSPDVPRMMNEVGISDFYKAKWAFYGPEIHNPIGCADCHDPKTMKLRISRPALIEAFQAMGKDINKVSHNEMRSLVCAQCHVEYYFKGDGKYLTFPWEKGTTVEKIEEYYDSYQFKDWEHALSKAPMLKAQHPDYELFTMGIHAERGVSCADCHMPYISEGGQKYTNHHIQSPLNNINASCQVCHRESEQTLVKNVYDRQIKNAELREKAEQLLVKAHVEAKAAWDAGATETDMKDILQLIRQAQWRWDFAVAGHGSSFHAPVEVARILGNSIDRVQEARVMLAKLHAKLGIKEVKYPDISTKDKAQAYIGLDMKKLKEEKEVFVKTVLPEWDKKAEERESKW
ncbi:MAG: ammonia-forming cytochrome c nitrite reductase [Sphingobacteriales bacterium]|nr:ammonia-forming cytochrome c nitrite reductase [Sphingobacteriales bacterium]